MSCIELSACLFLTYEKKDNLLSEWIKLSNPNNILSGIILVFDWSSRLVSYDFVVLSELLYIILLLFSSKLIIIISQLAPKPSSPLLQLPLIIIELCKSKLTLFFISQIKV